jgi:hypothetical protein
VFEAKARDIHDGVGYPPAFRSFTEDEKVATDLFVWDHSFIPGLLQTERYALELMRKYPGVSEEAVRERTTARLARQDILTREEAPCVWALIDEAALRFRVGDAAVMGEQLAHLLAVSHLPNVTLQVVPGMEGHVGRTGAFTVAEVPGRGVIVNVEDIADGRVCEEMAVGDQVRLTFRAMQAEALHVRGSRNLIAKIAEDVWNTPIASHGVRALSAVPTGDSA